MKQLLTLLALLVFISGILLAFLPDVEAERIGGGHSFGTRPAYQQPLSKLTQPTQPTQSTQNVQNRNRQQAGPSSGVASRSGSGGLLGGLLMGGLIGSLFLGGGFEGFNLLDFVLLGVVGLMLFRFFSRRAVSTRQREPWEKESEHDSPVKPREASEAYRRAAETWGRLRSTPDTDRPPGPPASAPDSGREEALDQAADIPQDFDTEEFLKGARLVFARLQESWGARDIEDLEQLTSPTVFAEIKRQVGEDPKPSPIQILLIDAHLREVTQEGGSLTASVFYDALMCEEKDQDHPRQVREIWHFSKNAADPKSTWLLDGIQQLH